MAVAGFYDEKHGIALCHHEEIHYTTDGGKSWSKADYPTFSTDLRGTDPRGLELLKADMAWCCGSNAIFVTFDGGKKWKQISSYGAKGRYLSFVDRSIGWFGTANYIAVTVDGGENWTRMTLPKEVNITKYRYHYQTKNSGKTWYILKLPASDKKMIGIIPHTSIATIRFLDTRRGIVVLYAEKPEVGFYIFETEDGGQKWREEKLPFRVKAGSPFLSRDGKYLTINDIFNKQILLFRHLSVR